MRLKDLTGMKFGRLTVIQRAENTRDGMAQWLVKCDCGKTKIVVGSSVRNGATRSCGCRSIIALNARTKHNESRTRLYHTWQSMKTRTGNPNNKHYPNYGGRGIKVCDEWKNDFVAFRDWAKSYGYRDDLSIDRIDSNGNYEPSNCRWADSKTQNNNTRKNRFITLNNETYSITEWGRKVGIATNTILYRLRNGRSVEQALGLA